MAMDERTWRRHANPLSGWTRVATMPMFTVVLWFRLWMGWWTLLPLVMLLIWLWLNPRLFGEPESLDNWMSRGVLGEQVWLRANPDEIPPHHRAAIFWTTVIAVAGAVAWAAGLFWFDLASTLTGLCATLLGKLWFIDRMVWLQRENE
jgi:hypothetical protein